MLNQNNNQPGSVKIGEYTIAHLDGPSETHEGLTRLQAMNEVYRGVGEHAVSISMNGLNSQEANDWNSDNTRIGGPTEDYIVSVHVRR